MKKGGCVYFLTNKTKTTLYVGVTSDLKKRISEHKNGNHPNAFTKRYKLQYLVYYEIFLRIEDAIAREKQIKAGSRKKKEELINSTNPNWKDLTEQILS
jgi:putative endonuclease